MRGKGQVSNYVDANNSGCREASGVAPSTVSHTLSGKRPISADVRRRVLQAIDELGYQPHASARALATKRTRTIALVYPALTSEVFEPHLEFVSGVLQAANDWKYALENLTSTSDYTILLFRNVNRSRHRLR